ncbi:MAG: polysaccharide biosynthesis C-terminal domain-containing protein [Prolixibacteraceae bacterium]|nr:polysaccharide biosynthesis C-terminal domain-containing protein [Prolixibacteraceae bacterium]
MSVIIKQSIKGAFWSYLGIAVGYINMGVIMPNVFDTEQIGLVQIFIAISLIFSQFGTLGFTSVINRMFPVFRDPEKQNHGFLFLALITGLAGFLLSVAAFIILKPEIIGSNIDKSPLLEKYIWLLIPLILMRILFALLDNYNKVLYDAVTGTFWLEFMHKLINLALIILYGLNLINFSGFFIGYILSMSIPVFPVIFVLIKRHEFSLLPDPKFLTPALKKETGMVMLFGLIIGLSGTLLANIDKVFINSYLSLSEVGIFSVCVTFATLIKVPYNSLSKISTGIIAHHWKNNDTAQIRTLYKKSALNQAIVGVLIFVGMMVNLHNIFQILPDEYADGKTAFIIYSSGILLVTIIGMAGIITETSSKYKFSTYILLFSVAVQIILCSILIPRFNIAGAAAASIIALITNAGLQAILQRVAFRITGLSVRLLLVLAVGMAGFAVGTVLPCLPLIPDIIVRSGTVTLVYGVLTYLLKISPDINNLVNRILTLIFNKKS